MVARIPTAFWAVAFAAIAVSAAPVKLRVTGNRVNLRARPAFEAEVVGQVSTGLELLPVDSLNESSEWIKVRPPSDVDLWIFSQLLTDGTVNADNTLVRGGPGLQFKPVGKLPKGTKVVVRDSKGNWTSVAPVPAYCALWIHSDYVEKVEPPPVVPEKVAVPKAGPSPVPVPKADGVPRKVIAPASSDTGKTNLVPRVKAPSVKPRPVSSVPPSSALLAPANVAAVSKPVGKTVPVRGVSTNGIAPARQAVVKKAEPVQDVAPTVLPVKDAPSLGASFTPVSSKREIPSPLVGVALDAHYRQGSPSVLRGRLCKVPAAAFGGIPARYQLEENSMVVCRLTGCVGQWAELLHSDIEVRGSLWMLEDDPVPVLHVVRADRLFSRDK